MVLMLALAATLATAADRPLIAAHRGGALLWPENSLLAFRNALALGADLLETDVHLTADGAVVVLHDPTLDRTTTGRGPVIRARLADLTDLRLKAADGSVTNESIPRLAELLDLLAPSSAQLLLEIKVGVGRVPYPGIEEKVLQLVRARGLRTRVLVMAFEDATLARVRALDEEIRTGLIVSRARAQAAGVTPRELVGWATAVRANALAIDHRALDDAVLAAARAAGVRVGAWTVNEERDLRRVLGLGVDVVISDRPDLARRLSGLE
jgi:glycerophosphoryl diester phosphodiesterase